MGQMLMHLLCHRQSNSLHSLPTSLRQTHRNTERCRPDRLYFNQGQVRSDNGGAFSFTWDETGGPLVKVPTREGFGSVIFLDAAKRFADALCWTMCREVCIRKFAFR
jgi:hypothetical protein